MNRYHFYHNLQGRPINGAPINAEIPTPGPASGTPPTPEATSPSREIAPRISCDPDAGKGLEGRSLAMVYSPKQYYRMLYRPEEALHNGTLFRELDLPFTAIGGTRK